MSKIDISSTALEKGIDSAREFLGKLIGPTVEETGLMLKDNITFWRFKNQVRTVNKAREICKRYNINTRPISVKLIAPLLENCSLEEDEEIQTKWALLLSNLVDSNQNIQNHVFPYILSQLSKQELTQLEMAHRLKNERAIKLKSQLTQLEQKIQKEKPILENKLRNLKIELNDSINLSRERIDELNQEITAIDSRLVRFDTETSEYTAEIEEPLEFPDNHIKSHEISNLTRLGLIKEVYKNKLKPRPYPFRRRTSSYRLESKNYNIVTELGHLFVEACSEKTK